MGPRSIDRGIPGSASAFAETSTLQWGRDQLIAELWWKPELRPPAE